ncbi:DUF4259 domain-containing protein [Herbiconiux sp.]|uniref:DUF4259 domain-containing protein n=1 Tax=Herbiconiux sp. TaxID=1871186 RepID=UPI0025BDBA90|nr:DUF4259 domain-containing protein [Herbiconiux sp.]
MGAWGAGPFENDGAADLAGDIDEGRFSFTAIETEFEDESYLEVDGGQWVLALAEIVVSSREGRELPVPGDFSAFVAGLSPERIAWIHHHCRRRPNIGRFRRVKSERLRAV